MTNEERAVFIGERLWNLKINPFDPTLIIWDNPDKTRGFLNFEDDKQYFLEWLSSPEGIFAVKDAMIEKGWQISTVSNDHGCNCLMINMHKTTQHYMGSKKTEDKAVLAAAEKALRAEVSETDKS